MVSIILSHRNSDVKIRTYALLDNCSQGSFVKYELLKKFDVKKTNTSVSITTVCGEGEIA